MVELFQELHLLQDVCDVSLRLAYDSFACCLPVRGTVDGKTNRRVRSTVDQYPAAMINMHPRQAMTIAPSEFPTRDHVLANNLQSLSTRKYMSSSNKDEHGEGSAWVGSVWQPGWRNSRK
jgi:hypothetical protein